ncbi:transposase [Mesorhizobium vachelliae]|uniref:transposase n=1 Tax=Mesorhizobium vachelliae TaxID=3072309 RepID=UPI003D314C95
MSHVTLLTGPERRRRWSEEDQCRILAAAFAPGSTVAAVARQYDGTPPARAALREQGTVAMLRS